MKKIFIVALLACVLFAGVFILTGCGNKEETNNNMIKIIDKDKNYVTTFDSINNKFEQKNPAYSQVDSEDLGIFISMSYKEYPKSYYDYYKTHNFLGVEFSEGDTKDYKWNEYSGYTYSISETEGYFKILLEDNEENSIILDGYVGGQIGKNTDVTKIFDNEDFQKFLNTIEFKKNAE